MPPPAMMKGRLSACAILISLGIVLPRDDAPHGEYEVAALAGAEWIEHALLRALHGGFADIEQPRAAPRDFQNLAAPVVRVGATFDQALALETLQHIADRRT